ncbi:hypothetical protein R1flu_004503 [Riccia fluitans]|uniref:Ferredoxin n=1 Tax=Riccia fluitans TaxID=41844 RepID=A0ABD1YTD7_9MARC
MVILPSHSAISICCSAFRYSSDCLTFWFRFILIFTMAAALRRLAQVRFAHTAAASASNAIPRSAPKVLDSTVKLTAIAEEDGSRHAIRGMCGAECEVSVAHEWLEKLPPRSEDEMQVLESTQPKGHDVDTHSRLACQIILDPKLEGMAFAIPAARPWKTN